MNIAVIVTTYNRPDALDRVLQAWHAQPAGDMELLVADDGSTEDTAALVRAHAARASFPLRHVWHEDRGFRAGAIRNRAVAATRADYLLFTDGDCVPLPGFIARHRALARPGCFVAGNRVLLSPGWTARVLAERIALEALGSGAWFAHWLRRDVYRIAPLLSLPDGRWRDAQARRWDGVKTCNLGLWRHDFARVNGFDEAYSGWGLEDSDLAIRLLHAGVHHRNGRFATPLAHLWHRENDRSRLAENRSRLDALLASDRLLAQVGLDRHDGTNAATPAPGSPTPKEFPQAYPAGAPDKRAPQ